MSFPSLSSLIARSVLGGTPLPLDRPLDQGLEQHRRPEVVHADVALDLVHALPDADRRGQVHHRVHALQGPPHRLGVPHVAHLELDVRVEVGGAPGRRAVHLR